MNDCPAVSRKGNPNNLHRIDPLLSLGVGTPYGVRYCIGHIARTLRLA